VAELLESTSEDDFNGWIKENISNDTAEMKERKNLDRQQVYFLLGVVQKQSRYSLSVSFPSREFYSLSIRKTQTLQVILSVTLNSNARQLPGIGNATA